MKADKQKVNRLLKTARGQIDGILRMVEEDRYCMEISQQLMATEAILNKANKEILTAPMPGQMQRGKKRWMNWWLCWVRYYNRRQVDEGKI